ncbi:hypothetical protein ACTND3_09135 [Bacillota bacterium HCP28S3_F12]
MDQYFMNLYRTRLYAPLLLFFMAYVLSPGFRSVFKKVECWINQRRTWKMAGICAAISFLFCLGVIYPGKSWGGDFSQYFAQARAIATGTIPEWYEKNIFIIDHSCVIGADVYPWMWPLMIAPFYSIFHSFPVMLLKAYEAIFVAAGVVLLVFFLRRRISLSKAVFLSSFISCNYVYIMDVNSVEADLISFFWGMVALNFIDLYLKERKHILQVWAANNQEESSALTADMQRKESRSICLLVIYGLLGGAGICASVMTKTLCEGLLLALFAYDLVCIGDTVIFKKSIDKRMWKIYVLSVLPYAAFFLCMKLSNKILLPSGGSYRDYFTFSVWRFQNGIHWYYGIFQGFFGSGVRPIISVIVCICGTLLLILTAVGIVLKRKEELYYGFYVCGMILMLLFYDYYRSSFVLTFFPLMVLFSYYAVEWGIKKIRNQRVILCIRAWMCTVLILILAQSLTAIYAVRCKGYSMNDIMNEDTQEVFTYIQQNLNSEDVVYFLKPRVLYYYTDVYSYYWDDDNPERLNLADYVLMSVYNEQPNIQQVLDTTGYYFVAFRNDHFTLYGRTGNGKA